MLDTAHRTPALDRADRAQHGGDVLSTNLSSSIASRAQSREVSALVGPPAATTDSVPSNAAPVQTLVEGQIEDNTVRTAAGDPATVHRAAATGLAGGGDKLPFIDKIQAAFGPAHDLTSVEAHVGGHAAGACQAMGAEAYASGESVAFKGSPDLRTAAHEAAHIVQQRQGVQLDKGVGRAGDAYERHADAVADRVASGQSAAPLLGDSGATAQADDPAVQHYLEGTMSSGEKVRVSEDWNLVVVQESIYGSHRVFAPTSTIDDASSKLAANKSVIRLHAGGSGVSLPKKDGSGKQTIKQVEPENVGNKTKGDDMLLWADCGRSSGAVMGNTDRVAVALETDGKKFITSGGGPAKMKCDIMMKFLPDKIDHDRIQKILEYRNSAYKLWIGAATEADKEKAKKMWRYAEYQMEVECLKAYTSMSKEERDAFDKKTGINNYAKPQVGEGFTMSSGGKPRAGHEKDTWNFHWAGVVLVDTSGQDFVTLENYAVGDYDAENKEWVMQMYGSKKGQTFHHHHNVLHGQHGETPTTMVVKTKESAKDLITSS